MPSACRLGRYADGVQIVLDTAGEGPDASLAVLLGLLGDRSADVS